MIIRYTTYLDYDFRPQSEHLHIPTQLKRKKPYTSYRVISFGHDRTKNYMKFGKKPKLGSDVYVIIWNDTKSKYEIRKAKVESIFYFNYDKDGTLWNVWLDGYYHNSGLLEDDTYFMTYARAKWFLEHQLGYFQGFKEEQYFWKRIGDINVI